MNSTHNADSLVESALSLESLQHDVVDSIRSGDMDARQIEMYDRQLQLSTESYDLEKKIYAAAKGTWDFIRKTINATHARFAHVVEAMRVRLDKTGALEVKRLRREIDAVEGDGGGVFVNQRLADRLQIHGDTPKDFGDPVVDLLELTKHFLQDVLPKLSHLNKEAASIAVISDAEKAAEFSEDMLRLVKLLAQYGAPMEHFPAKHRAAIYPGGRRLFHPVKTLPIKDHEGLTDAESRAVYTAITETTVGLDRKGYNVRDKSYTGRLPVLSKDEMFAMVRLIEHLSDSLKKLLNAAQVYRTDPPPAALTLYIHSTLQWMKGDVVMGADGKTTDTAIQITSEDRARASWAADYFQLTLNDHLALLEAFYNVTFAVYESYVDYVRASLARYS